MRTPAFFALVGIFYAFFIQPQPTQATTRSTHQLTDEYPNYVVIGAFRYYRNATRFTSHAKNDLRLNAKYEMNKNRNLYYVYVLNTADREQAIAEAMRLRQESEFKDTWVYSGMLGKQKAGQPAYAGVDINPETNRAMDEVTEAQPSDTNELVATASPAPPSETATTETATIEPSTPTVEEPDDGIEGKKFFFNLHRALDREKLEGEVDVIDVDRLKKLGTYKSHMNVKVIPPSSKTGKVSLVCEVFGYRKVQREVDYANPSGEGITVGEDGAVIVPFELSRLKKGDIAVMYNVYFFKDAAVMRPESRYEVNSLMEMLKENPNYKIKIHGHTNGKASGRIISVGDGSTNYFSLTKTREGFGTAKQLSEERAKLIRDFLVSNGIEASRMQVKAWGGKRPIHDKHSTRAQENVRVEIEILED